MINLERGFHRLTWVISGLVVLPLIVLGLTLLAYEQGGVEAAGVFLGLAGTVFALLWLGFFLIRWIVRGFRPAPQPDRSLGVSLEAASGLPVFLLEKRETPFDDWQDPGAEVPQNLTRFFQRAVWAYQLFLYRGLLEAKFGEEAGRLAREHQDEALLRLEDGVGAEVLDLTHMIERNAASLGTSDALLKQEPNLQLPPEYPLALRTLLLSRPSPHYVPQEHRTVDRMQDLDMSEDHDLLLARCMEHGRKAALASLGQSVAIMRLGTETGPESDEEPTE